MSKQTRSVTIKINGKEIEGTMRNIRRETMKLRNEINNQLTPGTDKYNRKVKELQKYNGIISEHNNRLRGTSGLWGSITKEVKQFGVIAGSYFGAQALVGGVRSFISASADLDEQLADVRKVTGLTADEVRDLASELKKIDTRSSRKELLDLSWSAGKLGIQGKEDIMGFVRAADQINVALGKDLGADAVQDIGKLVSIFNLEEQFGIEEGMLKIASSINEIGMASTASEGFIVNFLKRMSGVSGLANISAADNIALAGTLDSLGQTAETSSTAISKTLITMAKNVKEYANIAGVGVDEFSKIMEENALEALMMVLEGVGNTEGGIEALAATLGDLGADGGRVVGVLGTLSSNIDEVRRQQEIATKAFEEGTSVTDEFSLKNQTLGAILAKLGKAIRQELVQPEFIEWLKSAVYWISENITSIITAIKVIGKLLVVYLSFQGALKAVNLVLAAYHGLQKAGIALTAAETAATKLLGNVKIILAQKVGIATKAQRLFNLVLGMGPFAVVTGLIAATAMAYALFSKKVSETAREQKILNKVNIEANNNVRKEINTVNQLLRVAKNENIAKEDRLKAIKKLNDISPEYLGNINLENINTEETTKAINKYTEALIKKAKVQAYADKITEIQMEIMKKQRSDVFEDISLLDKTMAFLTGNTHLLLAGTAEKFNKDINKMKSDADFFQEELNKLFEENPDLIEQITGGGDGSGGNFDDAKKEVEAFYKFLEQMRGENLTRSMSDNEKEVNAARKKYADQLAIAKQFWGEESEQYKELLKLRNEEIQEIEDRFAEEEEEKKLERRREFQEKWKELNDEIWLESFEDLREKALAEIALEEEKELEKLQNFENFEELKYLVEQKYKAKRDKMNADFDAADEERRKATLQNEMRHNAQIAQSTAQMFGSIAGMLNQGSGAWKAVKLAETKITMLNGVMNAVASAMELPFPMNTIVGATLTASVLAQGIANMNQIMNTEIPKVPEQYYTGGFNVKGGQDGKTYKASFSNQQGGYVGSKNPNVVLGGEHGEEYWMNADMLRNPVMADIANAMEAYRVGNIAIPDFNNIVQSITANNQMKNGGFDNSNKWSSSSTGAMNKQEDSNEILRQILEKLNKPSIAVFDHDYFVEEMEFMDQIKTIAKG